MARGQAWVLARLRGLGRAVRSPRPYLERVRRTRWQVELLDVPEPGEARLTVIIASTPRSGSNLLLSGLRSSERCGVPDEYLNASRISAAAVYDGVPVVTMRGRLRMWSRRLTLRRGWDFTTDVEPASLHRYLDSVIERRTTPNGTFSLKIHWADFELMERRFGLDETWFPQPIRWVYIRRVDTVAQAVSYGRAEQTRQWVSLASEVDRPETAVYSREILLDAYGRVRRGDECWKTYFTRHRIDPIEVVYEELAANFEGTVRRVLSELGESVDSIGPPLLERQADELNIEWARRFREDVPDLA